MPYGNGYGKSPKPGMLGSGGAAQAGSALQIKKQIEAIELRMTDPDYVPTAEEQSRLKQLRGMLENLRRK